MITLLLALVAGQAWPPPLDTPARPRVFRSSGTKRMTRLGAGSRLAYFEAFNGSGTTTACSTTAPTGAKGEALTFTRASAATCTKTAAGGLATTGIADGDLVSLTNNQSRVEYDSAGYLGLLVEGSRTNVLLRSGALTDAVWADVGTPGVADGATDPFGTTTGDTITDDDGAALEGRSQAVTVSAGAAYFMHCYVKAGTLTSATISIDGTTQTITGLSATTWSIVEKGDASSSGVSIPVQVLVGDAVGDTGTVVWGGCQVEAGTYRTSYIPTAGVAVARATELSTVTMTVPMVPSSYAAHVIIPSASTASALLYATNSTTDSVTLSISAPNASAGRTNPGISVLRAGVSALALVRLGVWASGQGADAVINACVDGTCTQQTGTSTTSENAATLYIGRNPYSPTARPDGIISRICVDPSTTRCR